MGLRGIGEFVALADFDFDMATCDDIEEVFGDGLKISIRERVMEHSWPRHIERAFGGEDAEIDAGDGAGCVAETHQQSAWGEAVE